MITSLYAENYKSFPKLHLDIDNFNILLGSNSCGKSSITNLLLMLSQTADTDSTYESILRLNGSKSSMGEALNIFPDKNPDKSIKIGWTVSDESISDPLVKLTITDILSFVEDSLRQDFFLLRRFKNTLNNTEDTIGLLDDISNDFRGILEEFSEFSFSTMLNQSSETFNDKDVSDIKTKIGKYVRKSNKFFELINSHKTNFRSHYLSRRRKNKVSLPRLFELIDYINRIKSLEDQPNSFEITIGYNKTKEECELKELSILTRNNKKLITINVSKSKRINVRSEIFDNKTLEQSRLDIVRGMNLNNICLLSDSNFELLSSNPFSNYIKEVITKYSKFFLEQLKDTQVNHVSPLRAFPQRYYLLEKSAQHNVLNATDGSQLAEILKNNPLILKSVNSYFEEFGIRISTAKTNDIIHRITVKQDNVTVELTDVGFGISQVLPIIVQALLSPENSITIIEQPEIHLHPKMQAWLTTVLVGISFENNKRFLIETHSDTIIKRLQLLMLDPNVKLDQKSLDIYHLERISSGKTTLTNVPLNDVGEISWPKGFMEVEINDAILLQRLKVRALKQKRESLDV